MISFPSQKGESKCILRKLIQVMYCNVQGKIDATSAGEFQNSVLRAFITGRTQSRNARMRTEAGDRELQMPRFMYGE